MRTLVTGGAGYIGSFLCRELLRHGHHVAVIDNLSNGNREALDPDRVDFVQADLADSGMLEETFNRHKPEVVFHMAASINVAESVREPQAYMENNHKKLFPLLNAMKRHQCRKMVFSSTAAVYGTPEYLPVDEDHPVKPLNPYGHSKLLAERELMNVARAGDMDVIIFRYFNAAGAAVDGSLGPCQPVKQNLIPILLDNLEKGKATPVFGSDWHTPDGTCIRDYVHVEDIVSAHLKALDHFSRFTGADVMNLGAEVGTSVLSVIKAVEEVTGRKVDHYFAPRREGDPEQLVAGNEKARRTLGWEPKESGIRNILQTALQWQEKSGCK